jgi:hypothetical protein
LRLDKMWYKLIVAIIIVPVMSAIARAQDFSLTKISNNQGASISPYMQGCTYIMEFRVNNPSIALDTARFTMTYDNITAKINSLYRPTVNAPFASETIPVITDNITDWTLYNTSPKKFTNQVAGYISFSPVINASVWTFGIQFTQGATTDNTNFLVAGQEKLQSVQGTTYNFIKWPCNRDAVAPSFNNHVNALDLIAGGKMAGTNSAYKIKQDSNIVLTLTDNTPNGSNNGDPSINEFGYNESNVYARHGGIINQYGIDIDSLQVTVTAGAYTHKTDYPNGIPAESITYRASDSAVSFVTSMLTRDRKPRNYSVTINPSQNRFFTERAITISGIVSDRISQWDTKNTNTFTYTFNQAKPPFVTPISPANGENITTSLTGITLRIDDDRAWVDIDTVKVTIGPKTYDKNSPEFTYQYALRTANNPNNGDYYIITIVPSTAFGFAEDVVITVEAKDLVGTTMTPYTYSFGQYACGAWLPIQIASQRSNNQIISTPDGQVLYKGTKLIISGSAYIDGDYIIMQNTQGSIPQTESTTDVESPTDPLSENTTQAPDEFIITTGPVIPAAIPTPIIQSGTTIVPQTSIQYITGTQNSGQIIYATAQCDTGTVPVDTQIEYVYLVKTITESGTNYFYATGTQEEVEQKLQDQQATELLVMTSVVNEVIFVTLTGQDIATTTTISGTTNILTWEKTSTTTSGTSHPAAPKPLSLPSQQISEDMPWLTLSLWAGLIIMIVYGFSMRSKAHRLQEKLKYHQNKEKVDQNLTQTL